MADPLLTSSHSLQGMGFHSSRSRFPASLEASLPSLPSRFGLDPLSRRRRRAAPLGNGIAGSGAIPVMHRTALGTGPSRTAQDQAPAHAHRPNTAWNWESERLIATTVRPHQRAL